MGCAEKSWELDMKHVTAHRTKKEKPTMAKMQEFVSKEMKEADDKQTKADADAGT